MLSLKLIGLLLCVFFNTHFILCQEKNKRFSLGLNYGQASQNVFPLKDPDYSYANQYLKGQILYTLSQKNRFSFELIVEPSIYFVKYQLLNKYFVTPDIENWQELVAIYTQKRTFNEYALNIGLNVRYALFENFSCYAQGSVGPMISGDDTERLRKGFAFSDILGLGFTWRQKKVAFDIRCTLRHNSNLDFFFPNSGHNSAGIESGISFQL